MGVLLTKDIAGEGMILAKLSFVEATLNMEKTIHKDKKFGTNYH